MNSFTGRPDLERQGQPLQKKAWIVELEENIYLWTVGDWPPRFIGRSKGSLNEFKKVLQPLSTLANGIDKEIQQLTINIGLRCIMSVYNLNNPKRPHSQTSTVLVNGYSLHPRLS